MQQQEPLVTVICLTFNHVSYVAEALESLVSQDTDFPFTVLVHDDASTDGTADVIRRYAAEYPHIVQPILQEVNQHSQGVKILATIFAELRSEYAAICEGDDFWTDCSKLQRQVDWMRGNPDTSLCGHATLMMSPEGIPIRELRVRDGDADLTVEQVLLNHDLFHTSSLLFVSALVKNMPSYFYTAPVGDRPLKMHLATSGRVHYFDELMSCYRYGVAGSWTAGMQDTAVALMHAAKTVQYLEEFDHQTDHEFTQSVQEIITPFRKRLLTAEMEQALRDERYEDVLSPLFAPVMGHRVRLAARVAPMAPAFARRVTVRAIRTVPSLNSLPGRIRGVLGRGGRHGADT